MKSVFTSPLSLLRFLTFFALLTLEATVVNARLTVRHEHSNVARKVVDTQELAKRSVSKTYLAPAPRWIAYSMSDYSKTQAFPTGSELVGFNTFIMSFWLSTNTAVYKAAEFTKLSQSTRDWIINDYHSHGISFLVSAFGYGDNPTSDGKNPVTVANDLAAFVKKYDLDGVDIDYEDFGALLPDNGRAEKWLSDFTTALRKQLPTGKYFVTHAPVAPWFTSNSTRYPAGAYRTVHKNVGNLIDWYNVQFYNQGSDYIICPSLLTHSLAHAFPDSSLFEIHTSPATPPVPGAPVPVSAPVPLNKLVIGKPASAGDATNGFMDLGVLSGCLKEAKAGGWNAGAFLWAYPTANSTAMKLVRSQSWPV